MRNYGRMEAAKEKVMRTVYGNIAQGRALSGWVLLW